MIMVHILRCLFALAKHRLTSQFDSLSCRSHCFFATSLIPLKVTNGFLLGLSTVQLYIKQQYVGIGVLSQDEQYNDFVNIAFLTLLNLGIDLFLPFYILIQNVPIYYRIIIFSYLLSFHFILFPKQQNNKNNFIITLNINNNCYQKTKSNKLKARHIVAIIPQIRTIINMHSTNSASNNKSNDRNYQICKQEPITLNGSKTLKTNQDMNPHKNLSFQYHDRSRIKTQYPKLYHTPKGSSGNRLEHSNNVNKTTISFTDSNCPNKQYPTLYTSFHATYHTNIQSEQQQYSNLAIKSIKKKYHVCNLKPYAVDNKIIRELQKQVDKLNDVHVPIQTNRNDAIHDGTNSPSKEKVTGRSRYNAKAIFQKQKQSIQVKLSKLLDTAYKVKNSIGMKKKKGTIAKQLFIQSNIQDDHENLICDYQQQSKQEKIVREKTIQKINSHLLRDYFSLLQINPMTPTPSISKKSQSLLNLDQKFGSLTPCANVSKKHILKFKKQRKVINMFNSDENMRQLHRNSHKTYTDSYNQDILKLKKQDYGIYSRSAKKALYLKQNNEYGIQENTVSVSPTKRIVHLQKNQIDNEEGRNNKSIQKIQRRFYQKYLGSYVDRKEILKNSTHIAK